MGQSPKGGGLTQTQFFFSLQNFLFLETTNLASPYFKTCVKKYKKIWLNLMHTNLISRLINTLLLFQFLDVGELMVLGAKKILPNMFTV